jgi:AraC family L-rhamnose operon transcriptional activator RhaR/AraC family L-rhamnose operon regulatory protein RhaS
MKNMQHAKRRKRTGTILRAYFFGKTGMPLCVFTYHEEPEPLHDHDFTELVVVLGGSGMHLTTSEAYPIQAGDVFVIHKNKGHAYRDTRNLEIINVLFDLNQLELPVKDLVSLEGYQALFVLEPRLRSAGGAHHHCRLSPDDLGVARELLNNLIHELEQKPAGYQSMATGLFLLAVGFLSRCYSRIRDPEPRALLRLGQTLSYIGSHYAEPVTLGQLAKSAGMSLSTLRRVFRRSFQTSPIDYLIGVRVQKSLEILAAGELNVTETAFRVGFNDSTYFARQFRKHMGQSPREFRRQTVSHAPAMR